VERGHTGMVRLHTLKFMPGKMFLTTFIVAMIRKPVGMGSKKEK
jgi:hypothetical protein